MAGFFRGDRGPIGDAEKEVAEVLNRLRSGQPLASADTHGAVRRPERVIRGVKDWVVRSRAEGPSCRTATQWISAPRGGGKTEALRIIHDALIRQAHLENHRKSLVASVNLKKPMASTEPGLQLGIFQGALMTESSRLYEQIEEVAWKLTTEAGILDSAARRSASLGIDVSLALAGLAVPGTAALGEGITSWFARQWSLRKARLESELRESGLRTPEALQLFRAWLAYSIRPNRKRYNAFQSVLQEAADRGDLFHLFCRCVAAAGYSTMIILVDEADELRGKRSLTKAFEQLWDRPDSGSGLEHSLDLGFVLAASDGFGELTKEEEYGGFSRRFFATGITDTVVQPLPLAEVLPHPDANDDFDHACRVVRNLLNRLTFGIDVDLPSDVLKIKREDLRDKSEEGRVTWSRLWGEVIKMHEEFGGANKGTNRAHR